MIGGAAIGQHAVGEFIEGLSAPLVIEPHSRITAGGTFQLPANVPTLIFVWFWNNDTVVLWNNETFMETN